MLVYIIGSVTVSIHNYNIWQSDEDRWSLCNSGASIYWQCVLDGWANTHTGYVVFHLKFVFVCQSIFDVLVEEVSVWDASFEFDNKGGIIS